MNAIDRAVAAWGGGGGVDNHGGPPDDGDMEARVAKLEVAVEYIQRDVAEMRLSSTQMAGDLSAVKADLAAVKVSLSHMPTTLSMWGAVGTVSLIIGGGLWWLVQQYLGPLLAKAAVG